MQALVLLGTSASGSTTTIQVIAGTSPARPLQTDTLTSDASTLTVTSQAGPVAKLRAVLQTPELQLQEQVASSTGQEHIKTGRTMQFAFQVFDDQDVATVLPPGASLLVSWEEANAARRRVPGICAVAHPASQHQVYICSILIPGSDFPPAGAGRQMVFAVLAVQVRTFFASFWNC
jgi:hypothetical protein